VAAPAQAAPIETRALTICRLAAEGRACAPMTAANTSLRDAPEFLLVREVDIARERVRADRPVMVLLVAMAASEVRWNGVVVGRNGRPGPDRASEVPGRFIAHFVIPPHLVRPGRNVVTARVSSHRLPLPVRNAVHHFEVADYFDPMQLGVMAYLPALLMIGVLAVAGAYFAVGAALDRAQRGAGLLAGIAGLAMAQLAVETTRAFVNYPYPWHVWRVGAIAVLAALTAVLVAAWAAQRFAAPRPRLLAAAVALAAVVAVVFHPGYDGKASWSVLTGVLALAGCAIWGWRRRLAGAPVALGVAAIALAAWSWHDAMFLDGPYYMLLAGSLALLVAGQVLSLRRARAEGSAEAERARGLERDLARRAALTAVIRDGARARRVPAADILSLKAADDYCEVRLVDGRTLLSTDSLAETLARLPGDLVRVHKSWAVNAEHVVAVGPRPGGRRAVTLTDGSVVPVGRTYAEAAQRLTAPATG